MVGGRRSYENCQGQIWGSNHFSWRRLSGKSEELLSEMCQNGDKGLNSLLNSYHKNCWCGLMPKIHHLHWWLSTVPFTGTCVSYVNQRFFLLLNFCHCFHPLGGYYFCTRKLDNSPIVNNQPMAHSIELSSGSSYLLGLMDFFEKVTASQKNPETHQASHWISEKGGLDLPA